jgi:hypothetical protein
MPHTVLFTVFNKAIVECTRNAIVCIHFEVLQGRSILSLQLQFYFFCTTSCISLIATRLKNAFPSDIFLIKVFVIIHNFSVQFLFNVTFSKNSYASHTLAFYACQFNKILLMVFRFVRI